MQISGQPAHLTSPTPNDPYTPQQLVNRRHAACMLGVSPGTIDNLRLRGLLPSLKIGARRLYDLIDLRAFINAAKGVSQ